MATPTPTACRIEAEFKLGRPLIGCRFDPSGRFLFASAEDDSVRRIDLATGTVTTFTGHKSWVRGLAFLSPGTISAFDLAGLPAKRTGLQSIAGVNAKFQPPTPAPFTALSGDYHGKLIWWPGTVDAPATLRTVEAHDGWLRAVAVSPDSKLIATCGNDKLVKLWTAAGEPVRTLAGHEHHVYHVAFHPNGNRLASCDLKGFVKDWDTTIGTVVREFDAKVLHKYDVGFGADIGGARGMAFEPNRLAVCGITNVSNAFAGVGNPLVVLFDWKDGKPKQLKPKEAFQGTAWGVAFHPAGFVVAAGGGSGGRIWFWAGDDPNSSHTVTVPTNSRDMALHPAGMHIALAGANGSAYLYTLLPDPVAKK